MKGARWLSPPTRSQALGALGGTVGLGLLGLVMASSEDAETAQIGEGVMRAAVAASTNITEDALRGRLRELTDDLERARAQHARELAAITAERDRLRRWHEHITATTRGTGSRLAAQALHSDRWPPGGAARSKTLRPGKR